MFLDGRHLIVRKMIQEVFLQGILNNVLHSDSIGCGDDKREFQTLSCPLEVHLTDLL